MKKLGTPPGEYFLLSRNAWAGTAGHGAALWSGDIDSTWDELKMQVTVGQGVGMSGVPLWTSDIGGYYGGDTEDPSFQRMLVRWFQFGAFCPLFRLHGHRRPGPPADQCGPTNGDNEVWNLAKDPHHYAAIEAAMRLRESLRGYVKQLNDESVAEGAPMMRPMVFEFPDDPVCGDAAGARDVNRTEAQFMLGSEWLVAPVTAENATSWPAYLPALPEGEAWQFHWNQSRWEGGQWAEVDTGGNMTHFPLFQRVQK